MAIDRRTLLRMMTVFPLTPGTLSGAEGRENPEMLTVHDQIVKLAQEAPLKMCFQGTTADECSQWQETFAWKLRSLLGPHQPPGEWQTYRHATVELHDHYREELILRADGHPPLPIFILRPKKVSGKRLPGVIALHGHGVNGYYGIAGVEEQPGVAKFIRDVNCDYGRQLVRRGYVVAIPCLVPFGPRLDDRSAYGEEDICAVTFVRMQLMGKVLMAENLRDVLWALELLVSQNGVDPERLGCVGLSYGGRMTMLAAALDKRILVAVCSGALNVMQERIMHRYSCGAQVIPGLLEFGDVPEIASLIAPRPCLWEVGSKDGLISTKWAEIALSRMRNAYRACGAEEKLMLHRFEGSHQWSGDQAYPLLERFLGAEL